ncbi:lipoprotein [Edwardsiella ictaluri]|nr:lipoprotein [Edwardsiella ictaluri]BEI16054.1 lipoprotein [Edwardsiella ictaluri]
MYRVVPVAEALFMRKLWFTAAVLAAGLVLTACNKLTSYSISEQQINTYLDKHSQFEKQIGVPGLVDARITLNQLSSQIGRSEPNTITLSGHANVAISSILGPQQSELQLTLRAKPVYQRDEGAIYLRDLTLVDYKVQPEKMETLMKALVPYLNQSLRSYFDQQPAYVLNPEKSKTEAIARKLAKGLEVKPGELVIPLTD